MAVMCVGILLGARFVPQSWKGWNEKVQMICTLLLIFSWGYSWDSGRGLADQLASPGVWAVWCWRCCHDRFGAAGVASYPLAAGRHQKKEETLMALLALFCLVAGVLWGAFAPTWPRWSCW